jgi:hypothetical protein
MLESPKSFPLPENPYVELFEFFSVHFFLFSFLFFSIINIAENLPPLQIRPFQATVCPSNSDGFPEIQTAFQSPNLNPNHIPNTKEYQLHEPIDLVRNI